MKAKKTALLIGSLIAAVVISCTGCGGQNNEPQGSAAGSGADAAPPAENVNAVVMGSNMHHLMSPPATVALDQFLQRNMAMGTAVYSKPSEGSSVLGSFNEGDQVWAATMYDNPDWYMIAYNGRVAYVPQGTIAPLIQDAVEIDYSDFGNYSYYDNSGQEIGNVTQPDQTEAEPTEESQSQEEGSEAESSSEEDSSEAQSGAEESSDAQKEDTAAADPQQN